ncbi:MAG TPA: DUF6632 domain-containing protein [Candidatus Binatia bacterium]|nr:DUF6632 domain-containing protein [Candidatus Binatia bacterium]
MSDAARLKILRVALVLFGLTFIFLPALTVVWPSGWAWHEGGRAYYLEMIFAVYMTLGLFLVIAARNPAAHKSLLWFTVWSSVAHGAVMGVQSFGAENHIHNMGHLTGDVPALFMVALVLAVLMPREGDRREAA